MRFLFVDPELFPLGSHSIPNIRLFSDSTSQWTPSPLAKGSCYRVRSGLSSPSHCPCQAHNKELFGIACVNFSATAFSSSLSVTSLLPATNSFLGFADNFQKSTKIRKALQINLLPLRGAPYREKFSLNERLSITGTILTDDSVFLSSQLWTKQDVSFALLFCSIFLFFLANGYKML